MFSGTNNLSHYSPTNMAIWWSMAFQAGAINIGGFLACHRFVTHTTGFATHFGAELASGNFLAAFGMLAVPSFFLMGAIMSAFFIDRRIGRGKEPLYSLMFFLIAYALICVAAFGQWGAFGHFGSPVSIVSDFSLLATLCLISGIQNALVTSASGSVVRTTHLTGITTDLGIGLVRAWGKSNSLEHKANFMRVGIIVFFVLGSTLSSYIFIKAEYAGFYIPAATSFLILVIGWIQKKNLKSRDNA